MLNAAFSEINIRGKTKMSKSEVSKNDPNLTCEDCKQKKSSVRCCIDPQSLIDEDRDIRWVDLCDKCLGSREKYCNERTIKFINRRKELQKARKKLDRLRLKGATHAKNTAV